MLHYVRMAMFEENCLPNADVQDDSLHCIYVHKERIYALYKTKILMYNEYNQHWITVHDGIYIDIEKILHCMQVGQLLVIQVLKPSSIVNGTATLPFTADKWLGSKEYYIYDLNQYRMIMWVQTDDRWMSPLVYEGDLLFLPPVYRGRRRSIFSYARPKIKAYKYVDSGVEALVWQFDPDIRLKSPPWDYEISYPAVSQHFRLEAGNKSESGFSLRMGRFVSIRAEMWPHKIMETIVREAQQKGFYVIHVEYEVCRPLILSINQTQVAVYDIAEREWLPDNYVLPFVIDQATYRESLPIERVMTWFARQCDVMLPVDIARAYGNVMGVHYPHILILDKQGGTTCMISVQSIMHRLESPRIASGDVVYTGESSKSTTNHYVTRVSCTLPHESEDLSSTGYNSIAQGTSSMNMDLDQIEAMWSLEEKYKEENI